MQDHNSSKSISNYGNSNYWDDGVSSGNFWKDYNGIGPYQISSFAVDNYPFVWESATSVGDMIIIYIISGIGITIVVISMIIFLQRRKIVRVS